jgi:hypothetical protein
MNKIVSFLSGLVLLVITFIIVALVALVYRANERSSIKSYIFQTNNLASQRVGELQDINDISAEDLRNKLIKKYVSEYFKVIPGENDVEKRSVLAELSSYDAYKQWQNGEAQTISQMSSGNMFRIVHVYDDGIAALNRPADYNYSDETEKPIYYSVRYYTETWTKSNKMATEPVKEQGTIYIEAIFRTGIRKDKDVQKYLQEGKNPVGLFRFEVLNIGNKEF